MSDFNIVGKVQVDAGASAKSIADLKGEINEAKKALDNAKIGSKEYIAAQEKLNSSTKELSKSTEKQTGSFGTLKQGLNGLAPGLQGATTGVMALGKQMWLLVANPIGAIVAAIVGVFALLYNVLKGFDPVMDAIEQGFAAVSAVFNTLLDGVLSLITGAKSLGDMFSTLGGDIKKAANEAVEFTKVQQDLDDLLAKSTVNQSKYNRQINELILQSKDRTKTEAERIALIDGALNIEEKAFSERKKIADQELLIAQNAIISGKNLSVLQRKQLKEKGVDYAILLKETKKVTDEEITNLAAALAKKEDIENQSITLREKALNRKYVLEDAAIAKQEALEVKQAANRVKLAEDKVKLENEAKAKKKTEDEAYFNSVLEKAKNDKLELDGINANLAELDKLDKDKKEADRAAEVDAEVEHGKTIANVYAASVADRIKDDNLLAETKQKNANAGMQLANAAIELFGRQSKVGKGIAAGMAAIDTFSAINKNLKTFSGVPVPGYAIAQAVATGIFGLLNVKKILSTNLPGGGGGSAPSIPNAPAPVLPQQSSTSLNASSIQSVGNASQGGVNRSFVLDADISNNQERQARLARAARLS